MISLTPLIHKSNISSKLTFSPFLFFLLLLSFAHDFVVCRHAESAPAHGFSALHPRIHVNVFLEKQGLYIITYIHIRSSGMGNVLLYLWTMCYSRATLTSSVSPVHIRSRSTSRFCLMLLMLSISWRTASAVLHTQNITYDKTAVQHGSYRGIWFTVCIV